MKLNLPTQLTALRILVLPVFVAVFYIPLFGINNYILTLLYALAGITDWFDGYLARKWNQQSALGEFLDPVADKLLVAVALVCLVSKHPSFWMAIPAAIIVGREITVSALREWMASVGEKTKVRVSKVGKVKTAAQMLAIGFILFEESIGQFPTLMIGYFLLYLAAILTLWSMVVYLKAAWPTLYDDPGSP